MSKYIITVTEKPTGDMNSLAKTMSQEFHIDVSRAQALLQRFPGPASKALEAKEAQTLSKRFERLGFKTTVQEVKAQAAPASKAQLAPPVAVPKKQRRGSLLGKILTLAIIPVLLTMAIALAVTWFVARPALYDQLLESARNPAIATAASLGNTLDNVSGEGVNYAQLQQTIQVTRQAFQRQNISFIVATDTEGNPLSGWFAGAGSLSDDVNALQNAIQVQATKAVSEGRQGRTGRDANKEELSTRLPALEGGQIEVVSQPLLAGSQVFGAVVVGVTDSAVVSEVRRLIINIALFSLIPILLAVAFAVLRARAITGNVLKLANSADDISRGNLETSINISSNDELDRLAEAIERLRVSMKVALDRARRKRN